MLKMHRTRPARVAARRTLVGAVLLVAASAFAPQLLQVSHSEVSLPGSDFEIDASVKSDPLCNDGKGKLCPRVAGANLKVDDASPSKDWANVTETRKGDTPSGSQDNSFTQGTKEDDQVPVIETGGVPPNKSDLKTFGVYLEENANGKFMHMYWHRVQDPSGTTNMDFEFNQSKVISGNGVTPVRLGGDLLIQYDLSNGGTNPQLFLSKWVLSGSSSQCEAASSTPCWGKRANLTEQGLATGSINSSAIPAADSDGLGAIDARTFGEATVDFDALQAEGNGCAPFGSAYLKSRSSDSFTAAMKDFIAPANLELDNCGDIVIEKQTVGGSGTFDFDDNDGDATMDFQLTTTGDGDVASDSSYVDLPPGTYTFTELVAATPGWTLTSITCDDSDDLSGASTVSLADASATIDLQAKETVTCRFTNTGLAKVSIHKIDDSPEEVPLDGATFTVYVDASPFGGSEPGVEDTEVAATCGPTDASGNCDTGTVLDSDLQYWVVETTTPEGYFTADPVHVDPAPGENVSLEIVDPRKFIVVTYVCRVADDSLYESSVTFDGETKNSWSDAPAGLDESALCNVSDGATFGPKQYGNDYPGEVDIPD